MADAGASESTAADPKSGRQPEQEGRGDTAGTAAARSAANPGTLSPYQLKLNVMRIAEYHHARRSFLDSTHRWLMFAVVVSGSATLASLVGGAYAAWIGFVPLLAGTLDLVFKLSDRARDHEYLYRRACELLGQIVSEPHPGAVDLRGWTQEMYSINADSPSGGYAALDAWIMNRVFRSEGFGVDHELAIPRWHIWLRQVVKFGWASYRPRGVAPKS